MGRLAGCACLCIHPPSGDSLFCGTRGSWLGTPNVTPRCSEALPLWWVPRVGAEEKPRCSVCVCGCSVPALPWPYVFVRVGNSERWQLVARASGWQRQRKEEQKAKQEGEDIGENKRDLEWAVCDRVAWASTPACGLHLGSSDWMADLGLLRASATEIASEANTKSRSYLLLCWICERLPGWYGSRKLPGGQNGVREGQKLVLASPAAPSYMCEESSSSTGTESSCGRTCRCLVMGGGRQQKTLLRV